MKIDIKNLYKAVDVFIEERSKKYLMIKKMNEYKEKLQQYKSFKFVNICEYEKRWQKLRLKTPEIKLYGIQFVSIGETVLRLFNVLEDIREADSGILHVILPVFFERYTGGIYNRRLFDLFGKEIYFIKQSNIDFWTYVVLFHLKDIHIDEFDKYASPRLGAVKVGLYQPLLPFSKREVSEGETKLKEMGVKGEFICLHARESNVKKKNFNSILGRETACRNCDINSYIKASRYFKNLNIQSVRYGKYETAKCREESVIDYPNRYYDEFMDFYLMAKCKFMISCDSGISAICGLWGTPVLATNMVSICYGGESFPDTGYLMYLPKKFYSKTENRYLNLYESLDIMDECLNYTSNYRKKKIVLIDNTEDEIMEAAIELNDRIENRWVETEEEKRCYDTYWMIMHRWESHHKTVKARERAGFDGYTLSIFKLCYSYLKNNLYLLDVDFGEQV